MITGFLLMNFGAGLFTSIVSHSLSTANRGWVPMTEMAILQQLGSTLEVVWKKFAIVRRSDAEKVQLDSFTPHFRAIVNDLKSSATFERHAGRFHNKAWNWFPFFAVSNAMLLNGTIGRSWNKLAVCAAH